jgi:hypothetical protein
MENVHRFLPMLQFKKFPDKVSKVQKVLTKFNQFAGKSQTSIKTLFQLQSSHVFWFLLCVNFENFSDSHLTTLFAFPVERFLQDIDRLEHSSTTPSCE